jgi:cytochrome c biogenesis protein CcdA
MTAVLAAAMLAAAVLATAVLDAPLALAFGAGMVAAVNPCGFAMLPAYLSYFCGLEGTEEAAGDRVDERRQARRTDESERAGPASAVLRALAVTGVMTAGFVAVFGLVGLVVAQVSTSILDHAKWATILIGAALVVLGAALLAGRELTVRLPHLDRGGNNRELGSMFLFGVSYAVASLSCTLPAFLATTSSAFHRAGTLGGLTTYVSYGLGMGLIVGALTLAVALARAGVVRALRRIARHVTRLSGALVLVAGLYVGYYGIYEVRLDRLGPGDSAADPVVDRALRLQATLSGWIDDVGAVRLGLACTFVLASAAAVTWALRRDRAVRRRLEVGRPERAHAGGPTPAAGPGH